MISLVSVPDSASAATAAGLEPEPDCRLSRIACRLLPAGTLDRIDRRTFHQTDSDSPHQLTALRFCTSRSRTVCLREIALAALESRAGFPIVSPEMLPWPFPVQRNADGAHGFTGHPGDLVSKRHGLDGHASRWPSRFDSTSAISGRLPTITISPMACAGDGSVMPALHAMASVRAQMRSFKLREHTYACVAAQTRLERPVSGVEAAETPVKRGRSGPTRPRNRCVRESGAGERVRTVDLNLGKVALYQLSYARTEDRVC